MDCHWLTKPIAIVTICGLLSACGAASATQPENCATKESAVVGASTTLVGVANDFSDCLSKNHDTLGYSGCGYDHVVDVVNSLTKAIFYVCDCEATAPPSVAAAVRGAIRALQVTGLSSLIFPVPSCIVLPGAGS